VPGFVDNLCGRQPPYTYLVRARDAVDNQDGNTVELSLPDMHFLLLPVVMKN
jgi:hypothetical protein